MADHHCGLSRAVTVNTSDPEGRGRIQVLMPDIVGSDITDWILPCRLPGSSSLPSVGEVVWIAFENGDVDYPVWIGTV